MIKILTKYEAISHFLSLANEDRYSRFCSTVSDEFIKNYVETAKGFFYGHVRPRQVCNGTELFPLSPEVISCLHIVYTAQTDSLEIAISVSEGYRDRGLGKSLLYFAMGIAEAYRASNVVISGLSSNSSMIRLAKSCGYEVKSSHGEFEGRLETMSSTTKEIAEKSICVFEVLNNRFKESQ